MKKHADEMETQGFRIDICCYPWVAYKGPRFQPTELHYCYTELESELIRTMDRIKEAGITTEQAMNNQRRGTDETTTDAPNHVDLQH